MAVRKSTVRQLTAIERQRQALELRKQGFTYDAIASKLGYKHASGADYAVKNALRKLIHEPAEAVLKLELERLDAMLLGAWPLAIKGDTSAIDAAIKLMKRRADMLGLDAPKERKVTYEFAAVAERVAADLGLDPADVLAEAERIVAAAGITD